MFVDAMKMKKIVVTKNLKKEKQKIEIGEKEYSKLKIKNKEKVYLFWINKK